LTGRDIFVKQERTPRFFILLSKNSLILATSTQERGLMFLKGVWFIIVGVLLLGHTPAAAEPYLRVCKDGVVYYYFASQEPTQPGQAGRGTPKLRGEVWIQGPSPPQNPPPAAGQAALGVESKVNLPATSPQGADDGQVVKPYDVKEKVGAAAGYLIRMLTKLGGYAPPILPAEAAGLQGVNRQQEVAAKIGKPQFVVPEAWANLVKSAQEQRSEWGQGQPGSGYANELSPLGYSFPVAGPFSFRDTWGESRSGGRHHRAVDIFAREGTPVYAITSGVIDALTTLPEAGIILLMRGQDGRGYGYMHLQGYAAGIVEGRVVRTGELIGYVGRTGLRTSEAHLHFQVYADHRLCKDDLLNPYNFLVQLCQGIGVTDLSQPKMARLEDPEIKVNKIQVYRRSGSTASRMRGGQQNAKNSAILVIRNF
jgi:hypothetical protein